MPLSLSVVLAQAALLAAMLLFILGRRAWRALAFRRLDRWQQYWLRRLGKLLDGETPSFKEMQSREARQSLESVLTTRLQAADGDHNRLMDLLERSGLLDYHIAVLRRGTRWQRPHAAALLGKMGSVKAVPALLEALEDNCVQVRTAALRSLGAIGSAAAGPGIIRLLRHGPPLEPGIWLDAAIACISDPNDFLPLFEDDRPEIRALAARAIGESAAAARFESLDALIFDPDPEMRAQAVRAVGRTTSPTAGVGGVLPALIAATYDEIWFVRLRALAALGTLKAVAAIDAVLHASGDPNFSVRRQAAAALASLATRPGEVLKLLTEAHDRYALESYLSQLARSGLLWRTVPLLCSEDESVRRASEDLLTNAVAAGYCQEVMSAAETHPDWAVRKAATRLLEHATPQLGTATVHFAPRPLAEEAVHSHPPASGQ